MHFDNQQKHQEGSIHKLKLHDSFGKDVLLANENVTACLELTRDDGHVCLTGGGAKDNFGGSRYGLWNKKGRNVYLYPCCTRNKHQFANIELPSACQGWQTCMFYRSGGQGFFKYERKITHLFAGPGGKVFLPLRPCSCGDIQHIHYISQHIQGVPWLPLVGLLPLVSCCIDSCSQWCKQSKQTLFDVAGALIIAL